MIKDRNLHYKSAEEIKAFQEERLRETLAYVSERSTFYKRMFKEHGIDVSQINTMLFRPRRIISSALKRKAFGVDSQTLICIFGLKIPISS